MGLGVPESCCWSIHLICLYGDMEEAALAFLCDRMVESISLFYVSSVYFLFGLKNVETPTE